MPLQSPRRQTINAIMQYAMQTAKITSWLIGYSLFS
jgi:hypothetical protein